MFKSNHSGIETLRSLIEKYTGFPSLNRITVGLKQINKSQFAVIFKAFKSNHSGIETAYQKAKIKTVLLFKSNHSGIETPLPARWF